MEAKSQEEEKKTLQLFHSLYDVSTLFFTFFRQLFIHLPACVMQSL